MRKREVRVIKACRVSADRLETQTTTSPRPNSQSHVTITSTAQPVGNTFKFKMVQRCLHRVRKLTRLVCRTHISFSLHPESSSP